MKTIKDLLTDYLEWRTSLHLSRHTIDKNRRGIKPFVTWLESVAVVMPDRIRKEHLIYWQKDLSARLTPQGCPLKPLSINTIIDSIKGFLSYLVDMGYLSSEIIEAIAFVKWPRTLPKNVLSHKEVQSMFSVIPTDQAPGYRDRTMLEVLYSSGIRAAELIGLDLGHIDMAQCTLLVTGKGNKQRLVPIGKTAFKYLETYLMAIRPYLLNNHDEPAVFLTQRGTRIHYHYLLKRIHLYADKADLSQVSTHTFRRSCTTELIRGGANIYHVKELLGHETLDTLKHYTRLTITDLKQTHKTCHPRERDPA